MIKQRKDSLVIQILQYKFMKTDQEVLERNAGFHILTHPISSQFIRIREGNSEQKYWIQNDRACHVEKSFVNPCSYLFLSILNQRTRKHWMLQSHYDVGHTSSVLFNHCWIPIIIQQYFTFYWFPVPLAELCYKSSTSSLSLQWPHAP